MISNKCPDICCSILFYFVFYWVIILYNYDCRFDKLIRVDQGQSNILTTQYSFYFFKKILLIQRIKNLVDTLKPTPMKYTQRVFIE